MLNTYFSLLPIYLPYLARIQQTIFGSLREFTTSFLKKLTNQLVRVDWKKAKFFLFTKQYSRKRVRLMKFLQIPVVLISITAFLTLGPNTSVLADWEEKVVPDNQLIQNNKLIFEISSVEIPKFQKPLEITYVSTYFSRFHQGIDLPSSAGTPIRSVAKGVVIFAGWSTLGYGNLVIVQHELGYESLYAHLSSINVSEGDTVTKETILGGVGSTGFSSGNHLHLEIHQKGAAVNPLQLIK